MGTLSCSAGHCIDTENLVKVPRTITLDNDHISWLPPGRYAICPFVSLIAMHGDCRRVSLELVSMVIFQNLHYAMRHHLISRTQSCDPRENIVDQSITQMNVEEVDMWHEQE